MTQRLTPIDILNTKFGRRLRGYSVSEVDEFARRVATELGNSLEECSKLRERNEGIERELAQYRTLEVTLRETLVVAQKAADETRAAARAQAEAQLLEAQARIREYDARMQEKIAELTSHIEMLRHERKRLARDMKARLTTELAWVNEELNADVADVEPPLSIPAQESPREQAEPLWLMPTVESVTAEES